MALSTNKVVGYKYDNRSGTLQNGETWSVNAVWLHILSTDIPGVTGCATQQIKINGDEFVGITGFTINQLETLLNQECYPIYMKNEKGNEIIQRILFPGLDIATGTPIAEEKKTK